MGPERSQSGGQEFLQGTAQPDAEPRPTEPDLAFSSEALRNELRRLFDEVRAEASDNGHASSAQEDIGMAGQRVEIHNHIETPADAAPLAGGDSPDKKRGLLRGWKRKTAAAVVAGVAALGASAKLGLLNFGGLPNNHPAIEKIAEDGGYLKQVKNLDWILLWRGTGGNAISSNMCSGKHDLLIGGIVCGATNRSFYLPRTGNLNLYLPGQVNGKPTISLFPYYVDKAVKNAAGKVIKQPVIGVGAYVDIDSMIVDDSGMTCALDDSKECAATVTPSIADKAEAAAPMIISLLPIGRLALTARAIIGTAASGAFEFLNHNEAQNTLSEGLSLADATDAAYQHVCGPLLARKHFVITGAQSYIEILLSMNAGFDSRMPGGKDAANFFENASQLPIKILLRYKGKPIDVAQLPVNFSAPMPTTASVAKEIGHGATADGTSFEKANIVNCEPDFLPPSDIVTSGIKNQLKNRRLALNSNVSG